MLQHRRGTTYFVTARSLGHHQQRGAVPSLVSASLQSPCRG